MVDANVLVSELLRVRGRGLIGNSALELRVSEETLDEALHEMTKRATRIVEQSRVNRDTANTMLEDARGIVDRRVLPVPREVYASFEDQASYRIPRDRNDVPTVALALALGGDEGRCGIWTSDQDFLGCGVPTWTTETLLAHLRY